MNTIIKFILINGSMLFYISCDKSGEAEIIAEFKVNSDARLATCNDKLIAVDYDYNMYIWGWNDLRKPCDHYTGTSTVMTVVHSGEILEAIRENKEIRKHPIVIKDSNNRQIKQYILGENWYAKGISNTLDGRYFSLLIKENITYDPEFDDGGRYRITFLDPNSNDLNIIDEFREGPYMTVHTLAISNDTKYVAVVGVNNGGWIRVVDVKQKKVIWDLVPSWSVNFNALCFSPDSKTIYIGGNGGVYHFDVKTGKITFPWLEMNERCIGVTSSPDGHLVAAGAGGSGFVYIINAAAGKTIKKIQTGQYTVYNLAFSPNSKLLATEGVKNTNIKIWKMPE